MLKGTIRSYHEDVRHKLWAEIERALQISETLGGRYQLDIIQGYPPMDNDPQVNSWIRDTARDLLGETAVVDTEFGMGAEDFAFMIQQAPGAMFMLGAAIPDGLERHHHTDSFDIDEGVIPLGTAVLAETARRFVTGELTTS